MYKSCPQIGGRGVVQPPAPPPLYLPTPLLKLPAKCKASSARLSDASATATTYQPPPPYLVGDEVM